MPTDLSKLGGWVPDPLAVQAVLSGMPRPTFGSAAPLLKGSGDDATVLLYKAFKEVNGGKYIPYVAQGTGDCVSMGTAHGIDLLSAVEITIGKEPEEFKQTATEVVYAMSRVDIGGGQLGRSAGSVGAWAAKAVSTLGTVSRDVVGPYSAQRADDWGYRGVPAEIKAKAKDYKVRTVSLVSSWEEAADSIANGYPIPVCSNRGFTLTRDAQGFCRPSGRWDHCMLICGIRGGSRPGACIMQSWGMDSPSGPLDLDQPPNSFWADAEVVAAMLAQRDSWSLSGFDGYPNRALPGWMVYMGGM